MEQKQIAQRRASPVASTQFRYLVGNEEVPAVPFSLLKYNIPQLANESQKKALSDNGHQIGGNLAQRASDNPLNGAKKEAYAKSCRFRVPQHPISRKSPPVASPRKAAEAHRQRLKEGNLLPAPGLTMNLTCGEDLHTEDLLEILFPPRQFRLKSGNLYVQKVSATPATRLDVLTLVDSLNAQLEKQKAKECGMCTKREALYNDCFNEIIRQVAVGCGDRGKLLYRVKEELDLTKQAWKMLYQSAVKFILRNCLRRELLARKQKDEILKLETEIKALEQKEKKLELKYESLDSRAQQMKASVSAGHSKRIPSLKAAVNTLQERIELFLLAQNSSVPSQSHCDLIAC